MPQVTFSSLNQNLRLYYEVHGSGDVKILFIMGLFTDGAAWCRQTEFFAQQAEYQCVSYDNRGCGRSSSPLTLNYSTNQMANDALALIDHLQWKQCHVVGVSMGGMIALELAVMAPERILSLTLLVTHAGGLSGRAPLPGVRHILQSLTTQDEKKLMDNALDMLYAKKTLSDTKKRQVFYDYHVERFKKRVPPSLIGLVGQLVAVFRHYVSYADLLRIRYSSFPCLIFVGTEDRLVREANSYLIQRVLGCRLIKLEDAGHGIQAEFPEEVNRELFQLFESIRKQDSSKTVKAEVPKEYVTEIQALDQCCQHRTHCFVHDVAGVLKGLCFGMVLYGFISLIGLNTMQLAGIRLTFQSVLFLACLSGLRRSVSCVLNAFRARSFVREHRLQLDRAAHHGGVGVALPEEPKNGIPQGTGFDYPIAPLIITANLLALIYGIQTFERKV